MTELWTWSKYVQNSARLRSGRVECKIWSYARGQTLGNPGSWSQKDPIVYKMNLFGAMHPSIKPIIGEVPNKKTYTTAEKNLWVSWLRNGIFVPDPTKDLERLAEDLGETVESLLEVYATHYLINFGTTAGSHGAYQHLKESAPDIGGLYFGVPHNRINYGSLIMTELRKVFEVEVRIITFDDEALRDSATAEQQRKFIENFGNAALIPGDSHGKCSRQIAKLLSDGASKRGGREYGDTSVQPVQVRIGFPNRMLWKGTLSPVDHLPTITRRQDLPLPKGIENFWREWMDAGNEPYRDIPETGYDILLPLSGFKGNKPKDRELLFGKAYLGTVHLSENREAMASQMIWEWFRYQDLQTEVIAELEDACYELSQALGNPLILAKILKRPFDLSADTQFLGEVGELEDDEPGEDTKDDDYQDPILEILENDKALQLLKHPWIISRLKDRLAKRWKRYAVNTSVPFLSLLMQPADTLPENTFYSPRLPDGLYFIFRNPVRDWRDIRAWRNVANMASEYGLGQIAKDNPRGTAWFSHETAAKVGGDFDGDWCNILVSRIPKDHPDNKKYDGWASGVDYPVLTAAAQNLLVYYRDNYGIDLDGLEIDKPSKQKIPGDIAEVAVRRMDNKTGIVSNLIQKSVTNGTFIQDVQIPNIDIRTGAPTGGEITEKVIIFLGKELQIAVDRLKNDLAHNDEGINNCRDVIEADNVGAWMQKKPGKTVPQYKDKDVYKEYPIDVDIPDAPDDTVTKIVRVVNGYWRTWESAMYESGQLNPADKIPLHVSYFGQLFPNKETVPMVFSPLMFQWGYAHHLWYGEKMSEALTIGKEQDGSDPEPWAWESARKAARNNVRDTARVNILEAIEERIAKAQKYLAELEEIYPDGLPENLPAFYQKKFVELILGTVAQRGKEVVERPPMVLIPHSDGPIRNLIVKERKNNYRIATINDWAACFWQVGHNNLSGETTTAGLVFFLFWKQIIEQLGSPTSTTVQLYETEYGQLPRPVWGDRDAIGNYNSRLPLEGLPKDLPKTAVFGGTAKAGQKSKYLPSKAIAIKLSKCNLVQGQFRKNEEDETWLYLKLEAAPGQVIKLPGDTEPYDGRYFEFARVDTSRNKITQLNQNIAIKLWTTDYDWMDNPAYDPSQPKDKFTNPSKIKISKTLLGEYVLIGPEDWDLLKYDLPTKVTPPDFVGEEDTEAI